MKRVLIGVAIAAAALLSLAAFGQGWGYGMMGGYGPGYYGMGPGMMYGYSGYGMGPGMMYGYGPGYGRGYGPRGGYGPGMMWGWGGGAYDQGYGDLTSEQRAKIDEIQDEFGRKQWALMQSMHELGWQQGNAYRDGKFDEKAARQSYDAMSQLRKQMFDNSLEARKRIDAVIDAKPRQPAKRGG